MMPMKVPSAYVVSGTPRNAGTRLTSQNGNSGTSRRTRRVAGGFPGKPRLQPRDPRAGPPPQAFAESGAGGQEDSDGPDGCPDHDKEATGPGAEQEASRDGQHHGAGDREGDCERIDGYVGERCGDRVI